MFAGMSKTLAAGRIASFVFERHLPAPAPDDPLLELLADSGYEVYRIEKSPLKVRYVSIQSIPRKRVRRATTSPSMQKVTPEAR